MTSTLGGIYDLLRSFRAVATIGDAVPRDSPFQVESVGEKAGSVPLASGLPIATHRTIDQFEPTDTVIVPSVIVAADRWETGRYGALTQ